MHLQQLRATPHVTIYVDTWNNWLYLEWAGELTLPAVQHACLEIARCFVAHAYPRVLLNNANISGVEYEVAPWLTEHFFPYMSLAGVEQMAWVHAPSPRGHDMAEYALRRVSVQVNVALFADVEQAVTWLQRTQPDYVSGCALQARAVTADAKLMQLLRAFERELATTKATAGTCALA